MPCTTPTPLHQRWTFPPEANHRRNRQRIPPAKAMKLWEHTGSTTQRSIRPHYALLPWRTGPETEPGKISSPLPTLQLSISTFFIFVPLPSSPQPLVETPQEGGTKNYNNASTQLLYIVYFMYTWYVSIISICIKHCNPICTYVRKIKNILHQYPMYDHHGLHLLLNDQFTNYTVHIFCFHCFHQPQVFIVTLKISRVFYRFIFV